MDSLHLIGFWVSVAVLVTAALIFLLPPLAGRSRRHEEPQSDAVNAAVYRARLEELERTVDEGSLDAADFEEAKAELEREVLESVDPEEPAQPRRAPRLTVPAVALAVPAAALALYLALGTPRALDPRTRTPVDPATLAAARGEVELARLEQMTERFAERMENNPDQGDGWLVLARAWVMVERYDDAVAAFSRAHALLKDRPDLLVDYAEAEALANGNRFPASAMRRIDRALERAPRHEKGLWLGGFAAAQQGAVDTATARWRALLEGEPDSDRRRLIEGLIARLEGAPPSAETGDGAAEMKVRVTLQDGLREGLIGSEAVYVFARATDGGPPLAVYRTTVDALPALVGLNDSMAMVPNLKLSGRDRVVVTARVSMSGDAAAKSGDLQGSSGPVPVGGDAPVEIVIDERVP